MAVYVLIASDNTICGIYSTKEKMICDLTTVFAATSISRSEVWEIDEGFTNYLKINKQTTVTIEN